MSKRATIGSFVVIVLILLLFVSNPGAQKHVLFLEKKYNLQLHWNKGADSFISDDGSQYIYNNYYLFSTTSSMNKNGVKGSVGFLWMVF